MNTRWKCKLCDEWKLPQVMRSRRWIAVCMSCCMKGVNDALVRVHKLKIASAPPFTLEVKKKKKQICGSPDCEIELERDLSFMVGICIWCRKEQRPEWDDDDWFHDWEFEQGHVQ